MKNRIEIKDPTKKVYVKVIIQKDQEIKELKKQILECHLWQEKQRTDFLKDLDSIHAGIKQAWGEGDYLHYIEEKQIKWRIK